jgi:hypothetical protein
MKPSYEKVGFKGALRVWNTTIGYLDVSEEGHLLQGQTAAWVEETAEVIALIEQGLLVVVEGQISGDIQSASAETPKKKKSSPVAEEASNTSETESQVAVDDNKKEVQESAQSNNDVSVETV